MKYIKLLASFTLTIIVFYLLNTKIGSIPPMGKFLNPYTGIWQNEINESTEGTIAIKGLKNPVTVHYDSLLVPHVFAENELDLYRTQGYITAKHRLWQMEFQTYAAAGRLSEIIGDKALEYDRQERRRGMVYGAEKAIEDMKQDDETAAYIEAYAEGVNAYISSLDPKRYPVEYKLLDYQPELWSPKKTGLLLMYMTKMLAGRDSDMEFTNVLKLFGEKQFNLLFPDFFDSTEPIIPKDTDWSFIDVPQTPHPDSTSVDFNLDEKLNQPDPDNGSNNWAVSDEKSSSGHAILANDPHLGLNLPNIWFVMQLSTPTHQTYGATIPGALSIISGFNQYIAWGETNATRDVIDWYKIKFNEDRTSYFYDNDWYPVKKRLEEIKIKGKETFIDTVLYTHHGPVVFDKNFRSENEKSGYAMRWIGHLGGNNQKTFIALNRAENYDDYVKAISHWSAPAQNIVFASNTGDIALWIQGRLPNKWEGQGKFVMDGSLPQNDWQGFIPQRFNAHTKNPKRGFVSSANQHPVDENYPFYVFNDGYETYRNRVINDFFNSKDKVSVKDFKTLQNNNYNLKAAELMPYMLEHLNTDEFNSVEKEVYNIAKNWNYNNDITEKGPAVWREWWKSLYQLTWDEFDHDSIALKKPFVYQTIYLLKHHGNHEFMDIKDTPEKETAKDLFLKSFKTAVSRLDEWKDKNGDYNWTNYKKTYAGHLLQALPAFSRFNLPIGGDRNIVNATSENHGPSWKMIVEMSSPPEAYGIYPGGQSGNPGSKYYDNFIDDWANGDYYKLPYLTSINDTTNINSTQTLTPTTND